MSTGKSGPGGEEPTSRKGGQYGGGGGSRAGGRAGGGGGYSRAVIRVTPGERIAVTVGEAGTPHYAKPGDGVVVVAWGREINPTGDMVTCPGCADCPCLWAEITPGNSAIHAYPTSVREVLSRLGRKAAGPVFEESHASSSPHLSKGTDTGPSCSEWIKPGLTQLNCAYC